MSAPSDRRAAFCLCADDFGLHAGINDAVRRLADQERVHAVGALVGAPGWRSGAPVLRRLAAQGLDAGLHLDLTEHPLQVGMRRPLACWIALSQLRRLDRARIRGEIRAQLDTLESALGRGPAFVDGHQHVHQFPVVRDELLAELAERYGGQAPWVRSTRAAPDTAAWAQTTASRIKAVAIERLGSAALSAQARRLGFAQNRRLLGVYDFRGGAARYLWLLRGWMREARDGDLLMCHPGLDALPGDTIQAARQAEYEVLAGPALGELLRSCGLSLKPMSRILEQDACVPCGGPHP